MIRCGPTYPYNSTDRTSFLDTGARMSAWPSRGGVIILDSADAIDLEFLGLNPLDPPAKRLEDQSAEDAFCQRLLLIGAKWWDSTARHHIVSTIEMEAEGWIGGNIAFNPDKEPPPTMREKRFVKAAWPSMDGVWIAEFDTAWAEVDEEDNMLPTDAELGHLKMARTMDERSLILRDRFRAKFYGDVTEYQGYGFFNSWATKETGEVGPLLLPHQTHELWQKAYYHKLYI